MLIDRLKSNAALRRAVGSAERGAATVVARVVPSHVMRNKHLFDIWERLGVRRLAGALLDEPIPDVRDFQADFWTRESELVGVDMRAEDQLALLDELAPLKAEFAALYCPEAEGRYSLRNSLYGSVDAEIFYGLLRLRRPRRVYEIGSGTRLCSPRRHSGATRERAQHRPSSWPSSPIPMKRCDAGSRG